MAYDYEIQGVPLTDTRWANDPRAPLDGCWHLLPGTGLLPHFPGLRATQFYRPGQMGESQVQYAPLMPRNQEFRVRFLPVDHDPASPTYQREGRNWEERMRFLEANVNEFMFRTQLGATSSLGHLQIRRRHSTFEHFPALPDERTRGWQTTVGRVLTDVQPEVHRDALYADYTFIFTLPEGSWYTTWMIRSARLSPGDRVIEVPMGTAPVWDAQIAIKPVNGDTLPAGTKVLNAAGKGFEFTRTTTSPNWRVVDCATYKLGHNGSTTPNWSANRTDITTISSIGRPDGGALHITPGIPGRGDRVGEIHINPTVAVDVMVRIHPRFF